MAHFRGFSERERPPQGNRTVEDAPAAMRQQFVVAIYGVADQTMPPMGGQRAVDVDRDLYLDIVQSLSDDISANPANGKRPRIARDLSAADWPRVYDVIEGLWPKFFSRGAHIAYREAINLLLAAHNIAWDLGTDGKLHRVLLAVAVHKSIQLFEICTIRSTRRRYHLRARDNRHTMRARAEIAMLAETCSTPPNLWQR